MSSSTEGVPEVHKETIVLEGATVRLAGDSGDGMQVAGGQLTGTSALAGNDVATFPDFPAEIRAPKGTRAGVSGFQVQFSSHDIFTPGDTLDALIAMNPAALVTNIGDLKPGGILVVNSESFEKKDLKLAHLEVSPLEDDTCEGYQLIKMPMNSLTRKAVEEVRTADGEQLSVKIADRCKNFFAVGFLYWLYGRNLEPTIRFFEAKFGRKPEIVEANTRALKAGYFYGETTEAIQSKYEVPEAELEPGEYRNIMGNTALAWGLVAASQLSNVDIFFGSYPITPASPVLEELSKFKRFNVRTFQAEDEIAAACSTIGAAFAGAMAITASSGPGIALKGEALGLGMILELPMIILNIQRGGPSTGLPTKTEQSDLFQAMFGRNGECPLPVIAASSPGDCFYVAMEAWRIATRLMIPVMVLSDGYIANGAEPWRVPKMSELDKIDVQFAGPREETDDPFLPYSRDELLKRPWAIPGVKGLTHRIGGLEKEDLTGNVSYDTDNHQHMTNVRQQKVDNVTKLIEPTKVEGPDSGDLLVLSWGGTYGSCLTAVRRAQANGKSVAHCHLRWLNPFPSNLGDVLKSYKKVLIPELNMGQLRQLIRAEYLVDAIGYNKVQGRPFTVTELAEKIELEA